MLNKIFVSLLGLFLLNLRKVSAATCSISYIAPNLTIGINCATGYYLLTSTSEVPTDEGTQCTGNCALYLCSAADGTTACTAQASASGYFVYGRDKSLLTCTTGQCSKVANPEGYYVNSGSDNNANGVILCGANHECATTADTEGYYVNAGSDKTTKPIISCNNKHACTTLAAQKGYYRNAVVTAAATKSIIKCNSATSCEVINAVTECDNIGSILFKDEPGNEWHLCTKAGDNDGSIKLDSTATFESITIANKNHFPGAAASGTITVKVSERNVLLLQGYYLYYDDNIVIAANDTTGLILKKCTDGTCYEEESPKKGYYIDAHNNAIYIKCDGTKCIAVAAPNDDTCKATLSAGDLCKTAAADGSVQHLALEADAAKKTPFNSGVAEGIYLLDNAANNVFAKGVTGSYIFVEVKDYSITMVTDNANTIKFYTNTNNKVSNILNTNFSNGDNGKFIYLCNKDSVCKVTSGYMYNGTGYLTVTTAGAVATDSTSSTEKAGGTGCTVGSLYKDTSDSNKVKLCLATGVGVPLISNATITNAKQYLLAVGGEATLFSDVTNKSIALITMNNVMVFNNLYTVSGGVYVNSNKEIYNINNKCEGTSLPNTYYACTAGNCGASGTTSTLISGDYIITIDETVTLCTVTLTNSKLSFSKSTKTDILIVDSTAKDGVFKKVLTATPSAVTGLRIYDCVSGKCVLSKGFYYESANKVASCNGNNADCDDDNNPIVKIENNACTDANAGKVSLIETSKMQLCTGGELIDPDPNKFYVNDANGKYGRYKKNSDNTIVVILWENNNHYLIKEDHSIATEAGTKGKMIDCDKDGVCSETTEGGYYDDANSTDGKYIECNGVECTLMAPLTNDTCKNCTVGSLCANASGFVHLCLKANGAALAPYNPDPTNYLYYSMDNISANLFTGMTTKSTELIVIKALRNGFFLNAFNTDGLSNSVTVLKLLSGNKIKIPDLSSGDNIDDDDITKYHMYNCDVSNVCSETYGFVKTNSKQYAIAKDGSNTKIDPLETGCSSKIGLLYTGPKLCVDGTNTNAVAFASGPKTYLISGGTLEESNPFTKAATNLSSSYILIDVNEHTISLNTFYKAIPTCNGLGGETVTQTTSCLDGTQINKADASNKEALTADGFFAYYIDATGKVKSVTLGSEGIPTDIVVESLMLYECTGSGAECTRLDGYINVGEKYYSVSSVDSTLSTEIDLGSGSSCTDADVGKLKKNAIGKVVLCLVGNNEGEFGIEASYLFNKDTTKTSLVKFGLNENVAAKATDTIIYVEREFASADSYYVIKDGKILDEVDEKSKGTLYKFDHADNNIWKKVTVTTSHSYYINASITRTLIHCSKTEEGNCILINPANGYYVDSETAGNNIKCDSSSNDCVSEEAPATECGNATDIGTLCMDTDNAPKLFLASGKFAPYISSSTSKFYVFNTANDANPFTLDDNGADKNMIIEVKENSITLKKLKIEDNPHVLKIDAATLEANVDDLSVAITASDITKYNMFECNLKGICTKTYGYIYDGVAYYSINSASNTVVSVASTCVGNIGLLNSEHQLCIDGVNTNAIGFSTGANIYVLNSGTAAATNAFTHTGTDLTTRAKYVEVKAKTISEKTINLSIPVCTAAQNAYSLKNGLSSPDTYCKSNDDGKIYQIKTSETSKKPILDPGFYGFVLGDDGKIIEISSDDNYTPQNVIIIQCGEGGADCTPRDGFYKGSSKYYSVNTKDSSLNEKITTSGGSACVPTDVGKLKTNASSVNVFCIDAAKEGTFSENIYLLQSDKNKGTTFNFEEGSEGIAISATTNYMIHDPTIIGYVGITGTTTLMVCNSKGCSLPTYNTECSTVGEVINNGGTMSYCDTASSSSPIDISGAVKYYFINIAKGRKTIFTGDSSITAENGVNVILKVGGGHVLLVPNHHLYNNYYLIKSDGEVITTTGDQSPTKMVTCTPEGDCTASAEVKAGFYVSAFRDKHIIKCTDTTVENCQLYDISGSTGYRLGVENNLIINTASVCEEDENGAIGYYINVDSSNDTAKYIKCTKVNECEVINNPAASENATCTPGTLLHNGQLCLNGSINVAFGSTGTYLLSYDSNSLFKDKISVGKVGAIKISSNSMIIDETIDDDKCVIDATLIVNETTDSTGVSCTNSNGTYYANCSNGICLGNETEKKCNPATGNFCDANTYYVSNDNGVTGENTDGTKGTLYYCTNPNEAACEVVEKIGYFIQENNLYSCKWETSNSKIECTKSTISETSFTSGSIGNVRKAAANKYELCLDWVSDTAKTVVLPTGRNSLNHLVKYNSSVNVFGLNNTQYALVKITSDSVVLDPEFEKSYGHAYLYAQTSAYHTILMGRAQCPAAVEGVLPIIEFKCDKGICITTA